MSPVLMELTSTLAAIQGALLVLDGAWAERESSCLSQSCTSSAMLFASSLG